MAARGSDSTRGRQLHGVAAPDTGVKCASERIRCLSSRPEHCDWPYQSQCVVKGPVFGNLQARYFLSGGGRRNGLMMMKPQNTCFLSLIGKRAGSPSTTPS